MTYKSTSSDRYLSRNSVLMLIRAAIKVKSFRFARQVAEIWLEKFPGDLFVQFLLARVLIIEGQRVQSLELLKKILQKDPEFAEAQELIAYAAGGEYLEMYIDGLSCAKTLGRSIDPKIKLPDWVATLSLANEALLSGKTNEAEIMVLRVLGQEVSLPLPAIIHIRTVLSRNDDISINQLARIYQERWPHCLQFNLILAQSLLKIQDESKALQLFQDCVSNDISGQVIDRLFGANNRYSPLWPDHLQIEFQIPIPANVNSILGWNVLTSSSKDHTAMTNHQGHALEKSIQEKSAFENFLDKSQNSMGDSPEITQNGKFKQFYDEVLPNIDTPIKEPVANFLDLPFDESIEDSIFRSTSAEELLSSAEVVDGSGTKESLKSVEQIFNRLAKKLNHPYLGKSDNRFPMFVIVSSKLGLRKQYGDQTIHVINKEINKLAESVRKKPGWGAAVFYPDDLEANGKMGIHSLDQIDPWKIKLSIVDYDRALSKKGEKIGALMIIGGPEVVPYHRLPNPTDDADEFVFSDNPYATIDSNYFVTTWPVGRLPGEDGNDPGLLIAQIRNLTGYHNSQKRRASWWDKIEITNGFIELFRIISSIILRKSNSEIDKSLGYTASAWKESSLAVYRPIGEGKNLLISPPDISGNSSLNGMNARLGFFNLHGLEDTSEWYGQKSLADPVSGPDYPVALTPEDLPKNGSSPGVVFSEACYGGNIIKKKENESLALKFLSIGTPAFIGSTCISYGSVSAPLIAADLLAYLFWLNLLSGYSAGEAFMQAKIDFVSEMHKRQGFLDGEDQKTLLSFVLFGDPLYGLSGGSETKKFIPRQFEEEPVKTVCYQDGCNGSSSVAIQKETLQDVKEIVEMYLPGLDETDISVVNQQTYVKSESEGDFPENGFETKSANRVNTGKQVLTFKRQLREARKLHRQYAKATLDPDGKMIKLAISK